MAVHFSFSVGSPTRELTTDDFRAALARMFAMLGPRNKVLAIPPDFSRLDSQAGRLTCLAHEHLGKRLIDVMPALGTHTAMSDAQLAKMFPGLPTSLIRVHDWRNDVVTIGHVPADFVAHTTDGVYAKAWPAQLNRRVWQGGHDLILSIGQVVPHEVIGMANYNKNLFVGTGGVAGINESHFLSAAYGMERVMGRTENPLRSILNYAEQSFCRHLPVVYVLTVMGTNEQGKLVTRGLFIGNDVDCFLQAAALSQEVNITLLDHSPSKVVVHLGGDEFQSTWLGNKAIYRTRMAIADDGELVVLAPGVRTFGEDQQIDRLIRRHGYCGTPETMRLVEHDAEMGRNLAAAAHLIHGSSEGRFTITYCPGGLTREEIEGVGYQYGDLAATERRYDPAALQDGWNRLPDGEEVFFIRRPAQGLWATRERFQ